MSRKDPSEPEPEAGPAGDRFWRELDQIIASTPPPLPALELPGLGPVVAPISPGLLRGPEAAPYTAREHLAELAAATALRAYAHIWRDVLIGILPANTDDGPAPDEVAASMLRELQVDVPGTPAELDTAQEAARVRLTRRTRATLAAGHRLPFVDLCRRFRLSPGAAHALAVVVSARVFAPVGRLLGLLAGTGVRTYVTRAVIARMLGRHDPQDAADLLQALSPDGVMDRHRLVIASGDGTEGELDVDPVMVAYLRGDTDAQLSLGCTLRTSFLTYEELWLPKDTRRFLSRALTIQRGAFDPGVVILRGRRGSGRHTLAAALASKVGRRLTVINAAALAGEDPAEALRLELQRAELRHTVPCVDRMDEAVRHHGEHWRERLARVVELHPGLVFVLALPEDDLRIEDRTCEAGIGWLTTDQQREAWQQLLPDLTPRDTQVLLNTFALPPARMVSLVEAAALYAQMSGADVVARIIEVAARHLDSALSAFTLQRVPPEWDEVAAPPSAFESLRAQLAWPKGRMVRAIVWGPKGAGKSFLARAVVEPRVSACVDVPWLLSGTRAEVVGRIEHILHELDGSRRALLLEQLDVGIRDADPEVLRRFALQLWRLNIPVIATAAEDPAMMGLLDRVFDEVLWLPNDRSRRAAAWRIHLGDRVTEEDANELGDRRATMQQIARAVAMVTDDAPIVPRLIEALEGDS